MFLSVLKQMMAGVIPWAIGAPRLPLVLTRGRSPNVAPIRQALVEELEAEADDVEAASLGVADHGFGFECEAVADPNPVVRPRAARPRESAKGTDTCPAPAAGEQALLAWVQRRRQKQWSWAGIALAALAAGHAVSAKELRRRCRDGCAGRPAPADPVVSRSCLAVRQRRGKVAPLATC